MPNETGLVSVLARPEAFLILFAVTVIIPGLIDWQGTRRRKGQERTWPPIAIGLAYLASCLAFGTYMYLGQRFFPILENQLADGVELPFVLSWIAWLLMVYTGLSVILFFSIPALLVLRTCGLKDAPLHRAGFWFFLAIGGSMLATATFGWVSSQRFELQTWIDTVLIAGAYAIVLLGSRRGFLDRDGRAIATPHGLISGGQPEATGTAAPPGVTRIASWQRRIAVVLGVLLAIRCLTAAGESAVQSFAFTTNPYTVLAGAVFAVTAARGLSMILLALLETVPVMVPVIATSAALVCLTNIIFTTSIGMNAPTGIWLLFVILLVIIAAAWSLWKGRRPAA